MKKGYRNYRINNVNKTVEVCGKPVELPFGLKGFINERYIGYQDINFNEKYIVSELSTGTRVSEGDTQKEALDRAVSIIKAAGAEKTFAAIERASIRLEGMAVNE